MDPSCIKWVPQPAPAGSRPIAILHLSKVPPSHSGIARHAGPFDDALATFGTTRHLGIGLPPAATQRVGVIAATVARTLRAVADQQPDLVVIELSGRALAELVTAAVLTFRRRPLRMWVVAHDPPHLAGPPLLVTALDRRGGRRVGMWLSKHLGARLERRVLEGSNLLLAFSDTGAESLRRRFPESDVRSVPLPSPMLAAEPGTAKHTIYVPSSFAWSAVEPVVDQLLDVADVPDLRIVVGRLSEPDSSSFEAWRSGDPRRRAVVSTGTLDESGLDDSYREAAIVVRHRPPTEAGNAAAASGPIVSAMAAGCAIVSTDSRGSRACVELVGTEAAADGDGLAATIAHLAAAPDERAASQERARAHAAAFHEPAAVGRYLSSLWSNPVPTEKRVRPLAFYLPQFHPIAENDEWWGPGFTEWTNTAKARPRYPGHYQPHVPADLGYYDLRLAESRRAQAELAERYGVEGFVYWHYWFAGRRILERPFDEVLASKEPTLPFALAWANQTWSGIWHGSPDHVLIEQTYPGPDDDAAHFASLLDAFTDPRYVTVDGKPLFYVFRPEQLPEPAAWVERWQGLAEAAGLPGLYLVAEMSDLVGDGPIYPDPFADGFDAGLHVRIPVDRTPAGDVAMKVLRKLGRAEVYRYASQPVGRPRSTTERPVLPCVYPNWDNTPRSGPRGVVAQGSTPAAFERHVADAVERLQVLEPERRLLFVKSWNEWAEGNHLEPDRRDGHGYLEALARACGS